MAIKFDRVVEKAAQAGANLYSQAAKAGSVISEKATIAKNAAADTKNDISDMINELDRMLAKSITDYNDAYTIMNDNGVRLYMERIRSVDEIGFVEKLINSIANKPKTFEAEFEDIISSRNKFTDGCEFAERELMAARVAAGEAGVGLAAGATVAFMAPTAAMWVATTFGTASTGAAISALSGAAAQSAALAWLGGGALTAGGGGMAAGNALLAMAGPVGWAVAGASLMATIVLFSTKKAKLNKEKNEEIEKVKKNTEAVKESSAKIEEIYKETFSVRDGLAEVYCGCLNLYGADYSTLGSEEKQQLGSLVNEAKALSALLGRNIE